MGTIFKILSVILAVVSGFLYWRGFDKLLFPAVVIACVSFFLGVRADLVKTRDAHLSERLATESNSGETDE